MLIVTVNYYGIVLRLARIKKPRTENTRKKFRINNIKFASTSARHCTVHFYDTLPQLLRKFMSNNSPKML